MKSRAAFGCVALSERPTWPVFPTTGSSGTHLTGAFFSSAARSAWSLKIVGDAAKQLARAQCRGEHDNDRSGTGASKGHLVEMDAEHRRPGDGHKDEQAHPDPRAAGRTAGALWS